MWWRRSGSSFFSHISLNMDYGTINATAYSLNLKQENEILTKKNNLLKSKNSVNTDSYDRLLNDLAEMHEKKLKKEVDLEKYWKKCLPEKIY